MVGPSPARTTSANVSARGRRSGRGDGIERDPGAEAERQAAQELAGSRGERYESTLQADAPVAAADAADRRRAGRGALPGARARTTGAAGGCRGRRAARRRRSCRPGRPGASPRSSTVTDRPVRASRYAAAKPGRARSEDEHVGLLTGRCSPRRHSSPAARRERQHPAHHVDRHPVAGREASARGPRRARTTLPSSSSTATIWS